MAKTNNDRRYPNGTGPRPDLSDLKRTEAKERQKYYDGLSIEQKLNALDTKFGKDVGAQRVRSILSNASKKEEPVIVETEGTSEQAIKHRRKTKTQ